MSNGSGRLEGKVAVITGAASGIGAGTARMFVREGAKVVVADLQDEAGQALVDELGDAARFAHCDVTSEDDIAAAVDLAVSEFGRLDVMFNNAGIVGIVGKISEMPADAWDHTMSILLRGVFLGTKHAARVMQEQGSGVIISTSSTAGILGGLGPHVYTAAKHGINGMTKSVAREVGTAGVTVNSICPGLVITDIVQQNGPATAEAMGLTFDEMVSMFSKESALERPVTVEEVAAMALLLASDAGAGITGALLNVDGGTAQY